MEIIGSSGWCTTTLLYAIISQKQEISFLNNFALNLHFGSFLVLMVFPPLHCHVTLCFGSVPSYIRMPLLFYCLSIALSLISGALLIMINNAVIILFLVLPSLVEDTNNSNNNNNNNSNDNNNNNNVNNDEDDDDNNNSNSIVYRGNSDLVFALTITTITYTTITRNQNNGFA